MTTIPKNILPSLVFLLSLLCFNCSQRKNKDVAGPPEKKMAMTTVSELKPAKTIILPGDLKPWEVVSIHAKVKGYVVSVLADRGTHVKKGDLLSMLEAPELKEQLAEAEARTEDFRSQFLVSKSTYKRMQETSRTAGAVSANELDIARSKMIVDSMQVASAIASYRARLEMVNYLALRAPFTGTITERTISPGELVGPESANRAMFVIENSDVLRLTVAIPEMYSGELVDKTNVKFKVSALPERVFTAQLSRSSQSLDLTIRSMFVEFDVPNNDHFLKAGMYAEVSMPVERPAPTLFVPSTAVVNSTERIFVIQAKKGHARWVTVKTGTQLDTLTEIFGPINPGDSIVRKASEEIRDGSSLTGK